MTKTIIAGVLLSALALSGCAPTSQIRVDPEAVDDYVEVGELESVSKMPTRSTDRWDAISERHVIYTNRKKSWLIEFRSRCPALLRDIQSMRDADIRYDTNNIRPGIDTIRGCMIDEIYALEDYQRVELENLGEVPRPRQ